MLINSQTKSVVQRNDFFVILDVFDDSIHVTSSSIFSFNNRSL